MVKIYRKVQKVSVLTKVQKVKEAHQYSTARDEANDCYRIIDPAGQTQPYPYTSRRQAEIHAVSIARMTFAQKSREASLDRAKQILGNELMEEIGEDRLYEGPLYERENDDRSEKEDDL